MIGTIDARNILIQFVYSISTIVQYGWGDLHFTKKDFILVMSSHLGI